jgi:hypothetical protein
MQHITSLTAKRSVTLLTTVVCIISLLSQVLRLRFNQFHQVFVNLFFEHNNPHLDAGPSNLICAAFADVHTAAEKTNFGGQQLAALPAGKTFIQNSSGFSLTSLVDPVTPEGYELIFGPINAATNAQGVSSS